MENILRSTERQTVSHVVTDPETGASYMFETRFGDKDVEIDVLQNGVCISNVMVEVSDCRGQVIIVDRANLEETGGDAPQLITLFAENELQT